MRHEQTHADPTHAGQTHETTTSALRAAAATVGVVFLVVGGAGFVPGITTDVGDLDVAGHESPAELLGVFQVSILHNLVHIAFGAIGLVAAARAAWARTYLLVGGVIYLLLWVYGLAIDHESDANVLPVNSADNWLHLALGAGMVGLGLLLPSRDRRPAAR